jgi:hypothetical protein
LRLASVKLRDASHDLSLPRGVRSQLRVRLDADEEAISESDALIGRQHEGVVRKIIECHRHERMVGQQTECVESECGCYALAAGK